MKCAGFTPHRGFVLVRLDVEIGVATVPTTSRPTRDAARRIARSTSDSASPTCWCTAAKPIAVGVVPSPRLGWDARRPRTVWAVQYGTNSSDVAQDVHHRPDVCSGLPGDQTRPAAGDFGEQSRRRAASQPRGRCAACRRSGIGHDPRERAEAPPEPADRRTRTAPRLLPRRATTCFQLGTTKMSRGCHSTTKSGPMRVRPRPSTATKTVASVDRYGSGREALRAGAG